jgi:hypothetical protein
VTDSVYQRVLGSALDSLRPELRPYFTATTVGTGDGVFSVAGSRVRILRPMLAYLAWRGVLFPEFGTDVPFTIVNTPSADGSLGAVRTFRFPRRSRALVDRMRVEDGQLFDRLGKRGGLEARMVVTIDRGDLSMRSDRLWLRVLGARIPLPRVATVTVEESWVSGSQHVDVRLRSPLIGEWFRYAGVFVYRHEP